MTGDEHERQFTADAEFARALADEHAAEDPNVAVKLLAEATKARRAASALARTREGYAFVRDLEKQRRRLTKGSA